MSPVISRRFFLYFLKNKRVREIERNNLSHFIWNSLETILGGKLLEDEENEGKKRETLDLFTMLNVVVFIFAQKLLQKQQKKK